MMRRPLSFSFALHLAVILLLFIVMPSWQDTPLELEEPMTVDLATLGEPSGGAPGPAGKPAPEAKAEKPSEGPSSASDALSSAEPVARPAAPKAEAPNSEVAKPEPPKPAPAKPPVVASVPQQAEERKPEPPKAEPVKREARNPEPKPKAAPSPPPPEAKVAERKPEPPALKPAIPAPAEKAVAEKAVAEPVKKTPVKATPPKPKPDTPKPETAKPEPPKPEPPKPVEKAEKAAPPARPAKPDKPEKLAKAEKPVPAAKKPEPADKAAETSQKSTKAAKAEAKAKPDNDGEDDFASVAKSVKEMAKATGSAGRSAAKPQQTAAAKGQGGDSLSDHVNRALRPGAATTAAATAGASQASAGPVTESEKDAVRRQIEQCWNLPAGLKGTADMVVKIQLEMNIDGTTRSAVITNPGRMDSDPLFRATAESAKRAVLNPRCQPLKLPPDKYEQWRTITLDFNPAEMFRT